MIAFGLSTEHLVSITPDLRAEGETAGAFQALGRRAAERGLDLRVASAFRDYDRQVRIINDKWMGARPVTDGEGRPLDRAQYDDDEWLHLILRLLVLSVLSRSCPISISCSRRMTSTLSSILQASTNAR